MASVLIYLVAAGVYITGVCSVTNITIRPGVVVEGAQFSIQCTYDVSIYYLIIRRAAKSEYLNRALKVAEYLNTGEHAVHRTLRDRASFFASNQTLVISNAAYAEDAAWYRCEVTATENAGGSNYYSDVVSLQVNASFSSGRSDETMLLWGPLAAILLVIVIVLITAVALVVPQCPHQGINKAERKEKRNARKDMQTAETMASGNSYPASDLSKAKPVYENMQLNPVSWKINRNHLKWMKKLGEGHFGEVWHASTKKGIKGQLKGKDLAVKKLKAGFNIEERKNFLLEMDVMKIIPPHPNVIALIGGNISRDPLMIVMEYASKGCLKDYLKYDRTTHKYGNLAHGSTSLTSRDLLTFAYQVAQGMDHVSKLKLLHRDLAARNVLLGDGMVCKIADFGLARDIAERNMYYRTSMTPLPLRWMAVESIFNDKFTVKSDVWSFGILIWEIVTFGMTPYPMMKRDILLTFLSSGQRLPKPSHCADSLYEVMLSCWQDNPEDRPSFSALCDQLAILLADHETLIKPADLQEHHYENIDLDPKCEKF